LQLLQARDDDVTSPKNSYYIYGRISSQDKEIIFLENSYHIITADQEKDKVAEQTIAFFEKYRN
ncbi:MAG: carboxylesterase, partial [Candidatus Omnitrophota bacterium]|nr:carboxylesterase [Candidatus Omnitrophota bacterium]